MRYTVKAVYETGDSFSNEVVSDCVGLTWEDKELAWKAMVEINEHYDYATDSYSIGGGDLAEIKKKPWYSGEYWGFSIKLMMDDGKRQRVSVPWTGYFESLHSLEVVVDPEYADKYRIDLR